MPLHQEKGERLAVWQLISLRECFYQHRHFQEVSFSPRCSFLGITKSMRRGCAAAVALHALVRLLGYVALQGCPHTRKFFSIDLFILKASARTSASFPAQLSSHSPR